MAGDKKDNKVEIKKDEKNIESEQPKKKSGATPFLFIFTWLAVGAVFFLYVQSSKKISSLSSYNEKNVDKINNLEIENKVLIDKIEDADRRIEKLSVDMQVFAEKYSENKDKIALNEEVNSSDEEGDSTLEKEEKAEKEQVANNLKSPEEYEKLAYDSQAISAGLNDVSDRTAFLEEKIDDVSEKLEKARLSTFSNNLVLSAVKLREAINNSVGFEKELKALKFFAGEDSELEYNISVLERNSKHGIARLDELRLDFESVSDEILNVTRKNKPDPTIIDQMVIKLSDIVQVRKIEADEKGNKNEDIIARAFKALKSSNVEKAIKEAENLRGDSKVLISPWLEKANSYVNTKDASEEIFTYVSNKVSGVEG